MATPPPSSHPAAATSELAAKTLAGGPEIPSEYIPRTPTGEIDSDAVVTVTHGYGRLPHGWRNFIDRQLFVGGIARGVRYGWIQTVRTRAPGTILFTFRPDATEEDFARVCGLSPELLDPQTQVALLNALDPGQLVNTLGREGVIALCEKLLKAVEPGKPVPGQQSQGGRSPSDIAALRAAALMNRPNP
jgi:hypothetical protein